MAPAEHPPDRPDPEALRSFAALDIETTGLEATEHHLIAIGVGFQSIDSKREVHVHTLSDARGDEVRLIELAVGWLDAHEPEALVTYNGDHFDLPFLEARLEALKANTDLALPGRHIDLFTERKQWAELADAKWPSLEQSLAEYNLRPARTLWYNDVLTNQRFAEELAPRYLDALEALEFGMVKALDPVIRHYTTADIEATMSLYEADIGKRPEPPARASTGE